MIGVWWSLLRCYGSRGCSRQLLLLRPYGVGSSHPKGVVAELEVADERSRLQSGLGPSVIRIES